MTRPGMCIEAQSGTRVNSKKSGEERPMLKITKTFADRLHDIDPDNIESGAWISLVKPTAEELLITERITGAPQDFIRSALDPEESSRIEIEDNHILVLINVPVNHEDRPGEYDTIPLGMVVTPDFFVTICQEYIEVLPSFKET